MRPQPTQDSRAVAAASTAKVEGKGAQTPCIPEALDLDRSRRQEMEVLEMQVLICMPGHKTITLNVRAQDTILLVKSRIQDKADLCLSEHRLVYEGRQMEDAKTLADYGVKKGDILRCTGLLFGGMQSGAHIPVPTSIGVGGAQDDEDMPATHTPQVGALIVPSENVISISESSVSHLRLVWTHSANERFELISRNIP